MLRRCLFVTLLPGVHVADVFISYAREDRQIAEALARDLEGKGISVWWDAELVGADDYQEVILTALSKARAAIVIWTKASVKSLFVRDEARYALHYKKLVAVKNAGLDVIEIPFGFQSQHTDDVGDREQILRAVQKLGVTAAVKPLAALDTGWDRIKASTSLDEILLWLEQHPADPNRQEAFKRVRHLVASGAGDGRSRGTALPAELAQTSNLSAFLSGLTFRIPSFQLSSQGTWSSLGFAIGFLIVLTIGLVAWLALIGALVQNQIGDEVVLPVAVAVLAGLTYGTWLRFSSWATQRAFLAAYIVLPFFLLLTGLFGMLFGLLIARVLGGGEGIGVLICAAVFVAAIGAVIWKVRAVR